MLQVPSNIVRPDDCGEDSGCTATICWWNRPGKSVEAFQNTHPVASLPFFHMTRLKEEEKRTVLAHLEVEGRGDWNPVPPERWAAFLAAEDAGQRVEANHGLFDAFARHNKMPCALGRQYDERLPPASSSQVATPAAAPARATSAAAGAGAPRRQAAGADAPRRRSVRISTRERNSYLR